MSKEEIKEARVVEEAEITGPAPITLKEKLMDIPAGTEITQELFNAIIEFLRAETQRKERFAELYNMLVEKYVTTTK